MGIIRIVLSIIVCIIVVFLLKKITKIQQKQAWILACLFSLLISTLTFFFPFENAFITFPSAEESFNYFHGEKMNVQLVVDGEKSSFVIAGDYGDYSVQIIPKMNDGWKVARGIDTEIVLHKLNEDYSVTIYKYKHSQDYFVNIININGGDLEISDNCNSKFYCLSYENKALKEQFYSYYASIEKYDDTYSLIINEKEFPICEITE